MVPKHTSKTTSEDVMSCKAKLLHGEKCQDESSPQCLINSIPCANVLQWVSYEPHNVYIQIYCTKEIAIQRYYLTTYSLFKKRPCNMANFLQTAVVTDVLYLLLNIHVLQQNVT